MATVPFNAQPQTAAAIVNGNFTTISWIPNGIAKYTGTAYSGADSTTSVPKGIGLLCTLVEAEAAKLSAIYEETYRATGKADLMFTSGAKLEDFSIKIDAGDLKTLMVMTGNDPSSSTASAWVAMPDFGVCGHLVVRSWSQGELVRSVLIPSLSMKITEVPTSGSVDERLQQMITFYCPANAEIWVSSGTKTWACGFWKTPAINAAAPDGAITDFTMGTGNVNAGTGATSPVPLKLNDAYIANKYGSSATDLQKYFVGVWLDGVLQTPALGVTYNSVTRKIIYSVAPATGKALLAVYLCDFATAFPENWYNLGASSVVEMEQLGWPAYV